MDFFKPFLLLSNNLLALFLGILGIGFIIGFHELGHFLFGKLFNIKTPSFSIGFGPKLYKRKIGETEFSISAIPLGGYVETDRESFESKPFYQKLLVLGGGIGFNLLFAYLVFIFIFMTGIPKTRFLYLYPLNTNPVVEQVTKNKLLETININKGDKIIAINGIKIDKQTKIIFKKAKELEKKNKNAMLSIDRYGEKITVEIPAKELLKALLSLKIRFESAAKPGLPFFTSIKQGIQLTNAIIIGTFCMFKNIFVKRDTSGIGGPIIIIKETIRSAAKGLKIFLLFLAIISISLAILNLIPLPILDGGQIFLYTIEFITRTKFSEKTKEYIFIASWILMLTLIVLISTRDIWRLTTPYFAHIKKFFGIK